MLPVDTPRSHCHCQYLLGLFFACAARAFFARTAPGMSFQPAFPVPIETEATIVVSQLLPPIKTMEPTPVLRLLQLHKLQLLLRKL